MSKVEYRKGSLFEAPTDNTILIRAVSVQGAWGAGISRQFGVEYPHAEERYLRECNDYPHHLLIGKSGDCVDDGQQIGWLFTSKDVGMNLDAPHEILESTRTALRDLLSCIGEGVEIHAPKMNSGLFRVPWEQTEKVINEVMKNYPNKFVVWSLE